MRDEKSYIALDDFEHRIVVDCMNEMRNRFFVNSWGNPKNEIKIFNKRQKIKLSLIFLIDRQTYVKYDCENA